MTKPERRKLIAKVASAQRMSIRMREAWRLRKERMGLTAADAAPQDDFAGMPETDTALDELPDSLVG